MIHNWPWIALVVLGAYHGLNPAMGWLFALAIGLQEKRRSAIIGALIPIALGHAVAITLAILTLHFVQHFVSMNILKWGVASILFALGLYRLFRASHPRGPGMRVGGRDLFVWSFLMASAHGAGLMLLPILMAQPMPGQPMPGMTHHLAQGMNVVPSSLSTYAIGSAVVIHTASMLAVAGILAILFFETYEKAGLQLLRHAWLNFDVLWSMALFVGGFAVLFF